MGQYKKSQSGYILPIWGKFPNQRNLTKLCTSVEVSDVINRAKFGNGRLRGYNVTEGRIFHCSIGMDCRL